MLTSIHFGIKKVLFFRFGILEISSCTTCFSNSLYEGHSFLCDAMFLPMSTKHVLTKIALTTKLKREIKSCVILNRLFPRNHSVQCFCDSYFISADVSGISMAFL